MLGVEYWSQEYWGSTGVGPSQVAVAGVGPSQVADKLGNRI